jgi:hypothetical protein
MTGVAQRTKGAVVFTVCESDRLAMSMGAGTLGKYGCNGTILRAPSMRCDGTGRDSDVDDSMTMVDSSMTMVDDSIAIVGSSITMINGSTAVDSSITMVDGSMTVIDGLMKMVDGSITMVAVLLLKNVALLGSTESKHPYG